MGVVAMSGFWIHEFQWFGPFSIIHVLSLLVFATLIYAIRAIRRGAPALRCCAIPVGACVGIEPR